MTQAMTFPENIRDLVFESLSLTHDGIGVFDAEDRLVYSNRILASMFSLPVETAIGMTFDELIKYNFEAGDGLNIETDSLGDWLDVAHRLRRSRVFRSFEVDRVDNRWFLVTEHTSEDDTMLIFCSEITRQKTHEARLNELNERMTELAYRDGLTNIYNRRYFYEIARIELSRCARSDSAASLLMLDLDHFKSINDRFGHDGGDIVLRESAALIESQLRSYDIFGRLGGEEFAVLLPETGYAEAAMIAQRILDQLRDYSFSAPLADTGVTASVGIAGNDVCQEGLEQLIRAADDKLYEAKRGGRDQVCY